MVCLVSSPNTNKTEMLTEIIIVLAVAALNASGLPIGNDGAQYIMQCSRLVSRNSVVPIKAGKLTAISRGQLFSLSYLRPLLVGHSVTLAGIRQNKG